MFGKARLIVRQVVGVVGGLLLGICLTLFFTGSGMQAQAPAPPPLQPPYRGLDANLYMISAEYRAICYQTFAWSRQLLETKLAQTQPGGKPFAVVADLDETLLDNSGFQTMQVRRNIAFDKSLWDVWQKEYGREVRLVPGAAEFVRDVRALHVDLVYVSNRDETYRAETRQLLADLGIGITHENQLKLATDTSNKN
ncbi:MAG TPA: HAD family acid phosphatase, partial [Gemmatales bacterium]|nr:HAD family acid phosphatase [Gemmatales bacterium]